MNWLDTASLSKAATSALKKAQKKIDKILEIQEEDKQNIPHEEEQNIPNLVSEESLGDSWKWDNQNNYDEDTLSEQKPKSRTFKIAKPITIKTKSSHSSNTSPTRSPTKANEFINFNPYKVLNSLPQSDSLDNFKSTNKNSIDKNLISENFNKLLTLDTSVSHTTLTYSVLMPPSEEIIDHQKNINQLTTSFVDKDINTIDIDNNLNTSLIDISNLHNNNHLNSQKDENELILLNTANALTPKASTIDELGQNLISTSSLTFKEPQLQTHVVCNTQDDNNNNKHIDIEELESPLSSVQGGAGTNGFYQVRSNTSSDIEILSLPATNATNTASLCSSDPGNLDRRAQDIIDVDRELDDLLLLRLKTSNRHNIIANTHQPFRSYLHTQLPRIHHTKISHSNSHSKSSTSSVNAPENNRTGKPTVNKKSAIIYPTIANLHSGTNEILKVSSDIKEKSNTANVITTEPTNSNCNNNNNVKYILELREQQILKLCQENMEVKEEMAKFKEHQSNYENELNDLKKEFTQRLHEAEKRLTASNKEKEALKKQLANVKIDSDDPTNANNPNKNSLLTGDSAVKNIHINQLNKMLEEKEQIIAELREEGEKLSKQQLAHSSLVKKLRSREKEFENNLNLANKKYEEINNELTILKGKLESNEKGEDEKNEILEDLSADNILKGERIQELETKYLEISSKCGGLQNGLDAAYKEINTLQKSIADKDNQIKDMESNRKIEIDKAINEIQKKLEKEDEAKRAQLHDKVKELNKELEDCKTIYATRERNLQEEIYGLKENIKRAENKRAEYSSEISLATRPLVTQIDDLKAEVGRYKERISDLTKQIDTNMDTYKSQLKESESMAEDYQNTAQRLQKELDENQTELSQHLIESQKIKSDFQMLQTTHEKLSREYQELKLEHEETCNKYKAEIFILKNAQEDLLNEMQSFKANVKDDFRHKKRSRISFSSKPHQLPCRSGPGLKLYDKNTDNTNIMTTSLGSPQARDNIFSSGGNFRLSASTIAGGCNVDQSDQPIDFDTVFAEHTGTDLVDDNYDSHNDHDNFPPYHNAMIQRDKIRSSSPASTLHLADDEHQASATQTEIFLAPIDNSCSIRSQDDRGDLDNLSDISNLSRTNSSANNHLRSSVPPKSHYRTADGSQSIDGSVGAAWIDMEKLESDLKLKDGTIDKLRGQLKKFQSRMAYLEGQLSIHGQNTVLLGEAQAQISALKTELKELGTKYTALLIMYGEKEEMVQELRLDLQEIKDLYRDQMDMLLTAQASTNNATLKKTPATASINPT